MNGQKMLNIVSSDILSDPDLSPAAKIIYIVMQNEEDPYLDGHGNTIHRIGLTQREIAAYTGIPEDQQGDALTELIRADLLFVKETQGTEFYATDNYREVV